MQSKFSSVTVLLTDGHFPTTRIFAVNFLIILTLNDATTATF